MSCLPWLRASLHEVRHRIACCLEGGARFLRAVARPLAEIAVAQKRELIVRHEARCDEVRVEQSQRVIEETGLPISRGQESEELRAEGQRSRLVPRRSHSGPWNLHAVDGSDTHDVLPNL